MCLVSFFKHGWPVFFDGSMGYLKLCKSSYGFMTLLGLFSTCVSEESIQVSAIQNADDAQMVSDVIKRMENTGCSFLH